MRTMILAYDADCGFCSATVQWLGSLPLREGTALEVVAYQDPQIAERMPGVDLSHADGGVQLLDDLGLVHRDASAIAGIFLETDRFRWMGRLLRFPLVRPIAAFWYGVVARNRRLISRWLGLTACRLPSARS